MPGSLDQMPRTVELCAVDGREREEGRISSNTDGERCTLGWG
jgi:hypothetical protein